MVGHAFSKPRGEATFDPATVETGPTEVPALTRDVAAAIIPPANATVTMAAEFTTTIFAGMIGGICISLFEMQPASATGAILQEAINFIREPAPGTDNLLAYRQNQILALFQFTVMLSGIAAGTGWGRLGRIFLAAHPDPRLRLVAKCCVPAVAGLALVALTITLHTGERTLNEIQQTWICALFAVSVGLLWGIMPAEAMTTARSFLLKRAALGDLWALRQIVLFMFCVGFTGSLYQHINVTNPSLHLVGSIVVFFGLLDTGYMASGAFLQLPLPDSSLNPLKRWAPVISTAMMILFAVLTFLYTTRMSAAAAELQGLAAPLPVQEARMTMPARY